MKRKFYAGLLAAALIGTAAYAGVGKEVNAELSAAAIASMQAFIAERSVDGVFLHYDPVAGELLELELKLLHVEVTKKDGFYVSCANFIDQFGRPVDLDFLVVRDGDEFKTVQAIVHRLAAAKRPYTLD